MSYPLPANEGDRIAALSQLNVLDTDPADSLNQVTVLAKHVFDVPRADISLVDREQQWFESTCGWSIQQSSREDFYSAFVLLDDEVLVVEDTSEDERFTANPLATDDGVRFYAGAPLRLENDLRIGALCIKDETPRSFSEEEEEMLTLLADMVVEMLETRRQAHQVEYLTSALQKTKEPVVITEGEPIDSPGPRIAWVNEAFTELTGYEQDELIGETPRILQGPETSRTTLDRVRAALENRESVYAETVNYRKDGTPYVVSWDIAPVFNGEGELTHWVSVQHDVTDERKREEQLRHEATHDTLTGLPNRAALQERLEKIIDGEERRGLNALLYLDLDRFKLVNDSLGHNKGDELLIQVADILQDTVRGSDMVARIGGDEFAVCLADLDTTDSAYSIAKRLYDALKQPIELDEREVYTPASIGVVVGLSSYETVGDALRDADTAMYEAKEDTRQPFVVYEHSMTQKVEERLLLDTELRRAIDRDQFEPYFHPIVNLQDGSLEGFEVLARWLHPEKGVLTPGAFLRVAEVTGLIVPIGHQVIEKACEAVHNLQERRQHRLSLSLNANFSRQEFFQSETHALLTRMFAEYSISPEDFTMEVTERTVEDVAVGSESGIFDLKELGTSIVLDDFGTGYSSLRALRDFPIDGLKIDKDFVAEIHESDRGYALIESVIHMAHALDKTVTAEGIETPAQLEALREMEGSYGQGYLFTRPVSAEALEKMIDTPPWGQYWGAQRPPSWSTPNGDVVAGGDTSEGSRPPRLRRSNESSNR